MPSDFLGGKYGIVETDGDRWKIHRRFLVQFLKNFGMGKSLIEQRVRVIYQRSSRG